MKRREKHNEVMFVNWGSQSAAAAAAKSLQLCPTLYDPIDSSPPGSPVPGILQARTLEWVAISFSNAWEWKVKVNSLSCVWLSCVWLCATPWTTAHQTPPSMVFSRQEYCSGVPSPSPQLKHYFHLNCSLRNTWSSDSQKDVQSGLTFTCLLETYVKETMKPEMPSLQPSKVVWMCPQTMTSPGSSECKSKSFILSSWV